jgi:hypothetical protein
LSAYGGLSSIAVRRDELDGAAGLVAEGEAYLRRTGDQPQLPLFLRAKAELLEAQGRSELGVLADWTRAGAPVTLLAGRDGRSAWACFSGGHRRVLLTDVTATALTPG